MFKYAPRMTAFAATAAAAMFASSAERAFAQSAAPQDASIPLSLKIGFLLSPKTQSLEDVLVLGGPAEFNEVICNGPLVTPDGLHGDDPATKLISRKLSDFNRAAALSGIPRVMKAKMVCAANEDAKQEMETAILARGGLGYNLTHDDMKKNCPTEEVAHGLEKLKMPLTEACRRAARHFDEAGIHLDTVRAEERAKYTQQVTVNFQEQFQDRFIVEITGGASFPETPQPASEAQVPTAVPK